MKCHSGLFICLGILLCCLVIAFSTGTAVFLALAVLLSLMILLSLISVLRASHTLQSSIALSGQAVRRGENVSLTLTVSHRGLIPIAPVLLVVDSLPDEPEKRVRLKDMPGRNQKLMLSIKAAHVGVSYPGIRECVIEDLTGFFSLTKRTEDSLGELVILPTTFDTEPLNYAPGDPGSEIMARATEDLSSPSDIRSYQSGDPIKKIHWKLSLRKNELLVRKYDEPVLSEALILMDCSRPPDWGHPEAGADIRDTLLETAASVYHDLLKTDHTFRLPLIGKHPVEIDRNTGIAIAFDNLSRVDFSASEKFERILQIESQRLRKVGCAVIITARLNSNLVDMMIRIRRMGPAVRLYLITFAPNDTRVLPLIGKLNHSSIEVSYVSPDPV